MPINTGRAFVVPYFNSLLAFTYKETDDEYFITTCLTVRELHGLVLENPAQVAYLHYGPAFTPPSDTSNWKAQPEAERLYRIWKDQVTLKRNDVPPGPENTWNRYAALIRRVTELDHGLDTRMEFIHQIHGPGTIFIRAENPIPVKPAWTVQPFEPFGKLIGDEDTSGSERVKKRLRSLRLGG